MCLSFQARRRVQGYVIPSWLEEIQRFLVPRWLKGNKRKWHLSYGKGWWRLIENHSSIVGTSKQNGKSLKRLKQEIQLVGGGTSCIKGIYRKNGLENESVRLNDQQYAKILQ